jgi:hypothetical protein
MIKTKTFILILVVLVAGIHAASAVENPGQGHSLSVKFPAFSLNPGEKIAGIKVRSSYGQIIHSCLPGRWRCEYQENNIHCFCLHQSHAIALTSLLPELFVRNIPSSVYQLSIEATVEYLTDDGKEYSKEFREGDLIIK